MLLLALTWVVPSANAQYSYALAESYDWYTAYTNPGTDARQCTLGPNGQIYALSNTAQFASGVLGVYRIGQSGGALINSGMGSAGWGNAFDDSGNYVYHADYDTNRGGTQKFSSTATCFCVKVPSSTDGTLSGLAYIDATSINFGRVSWYIDATGNCSTSGTGYIWTVPSSADANILALKVVNGSVTQKLAFDVSSYINVTGVGVDNIIQFYDTKDVTSYKCMLQMRGIGIYDITLNLNTQKVVSCNKITDSNGNCMSLAANIFTLQGHKFVVRNTRRVGSTGGEMNLCTEFEILDITDSYTAPVSYGARDPFPNASVGASTGSYIQTYVSGNVAKIYAYVMGGGVACYSFTATPKSVPVTNLNVTLVEDDDPNYIGRQNAEIVWSANPGWSTQPTSYKVEYKYTYNLGNGELSSSWYSAGTTTTLPTVDNPFVHVNIHYYKYGIKNVPRTYVYRVTPIFGDVEGVVSDESVGITPKYIPIAPRWIYLFGEETYQGLCMTQLYWDYPSYGLKPDSYDIYRDGQKITGEEHVAAFVKVDYNAKANTTHQYEITTYYNGLDNSAPARSSVKTVTIGSRDWSKPKYTITEIYNFDLDDEHMQYEIADGVCGEYAPFYKANIYTQGTFRDGKWYVAQRFNGHVAEGSVTKDIADAGTSTGGIIVFDADAQAQSNGKMVGGKLLSLNTPIRHNQTRGVAVDDAGNVFVRGVGAYNSTDWCYIYEYQYPLTDGVVYKPEANGTYTAYTVDFVGAGIDLEEQQQAYTNDYTMGGRVDYFSMSGDVFSTEGGYLYVVPSQGRAVYVINLKAGSGTTLKATLVGVYHENGTIQNTQTTSGPQPYKSANENYAFPVNCEGRNGHQFVFNLRSNLYRNLVIDNTVGRVTHEGTLNDRDGNTIAGSPYSLNVKGVEGYAPATPTVNAEGRIYDFHSRVNNSGGATFEFNGELFIVTPISQYSINTGSFYVGRGFRKTVSIDPITGVATRVSAKDADLCNIIPVATVYQSDDADASNTTASGMWCYGEVPDYDAEVARVGLDNADKDGDGKIDYAYIYIFAPGNRFAKYRIDPDGLFPPSPNEVEIVPEYERDYVDGEHNAGGELLKYDAVVEWDAIENAYNTDGTGNYSVESYTITLCYEDGTPVTDENGNPLTVTIPIYNPVTGESSEYVVLDDEGNVINYTYTFPDVDLYDEDGNVITYVSQVVVNYRGVDGTAAQGKTQTSVKTEDENHNDYDAVAPGGEVRVGVAEDWADWDGDHNKSKDDGYWNRYTVELHPTNPEWGQDQREEPVSYYTITVSSGDSETNDADKGNKQICDFYLYDPDSDAETEGVQNVTGLTPDENGYVHITDCKIPGDYVFTPDDNIPDVYWFEVDYTGGTQGTAAELEDGKINPEEWTYTITAEYAASNTKISKSASGDMENNGGVTTRVEVINVKSALSIYPIPATSSITVKASEAINTIAIYSMAGVQVKAVACEGENVVVVSVEDLAAGQYMVKVNNFEPVKIVKQ